jgi:hypothetical protein
MNPNIMIWLATSSLLIHYLLGALQSNTLNAMLASMGLPAIPASVIPWLGLLLGLGSGILSGLTQGQTLQVAIATAIANMVGGGTAALHLETVRGNAPMNDNSKPPQAPPQTKAA